MEFRFDAEEWIRRTPEGRARQCRLMAAQARCLAESASSSDLKASYSKIAEEWETLEEDIDRKLKV